MHPAFRSAFRLATSVLCALTAVACSPGSGGPLVLAELRGKVVDLETRAPVAGALVVEWYVGGGPSDGARPVHNARWTMSEADGSFRIVEERAAARMIVGSSYGPRFGVVHPDYGLQRQARESNGAWILELDARRTPQARQDLQPYCRGERDDAGARRIREFACSATPSRRTVPTSRVR